MLANCHLSAWADTLPRGNNVNAAHCSWDQLAVFWCAMLACLTALVVSVMREPPSLLLLPCTLSLSVFASCGVTAGYQELCGPNEPLNK